MRNHRYKLTMVSLVWGARRVTMFVMLPTIYGKVVYDFDTLCKRLGVPRGATICVGG